MNKENHLLALKEEIEQDTNLPLLESNLVFGEGNHDCDVMFIGEAPGFHENEQKRPFVGRAGKLLDKLIEEIGWNRKDVYITNIVKRRPPENRDPSPEEIESYKPYLSRQIEIINPKIIATLGRFSMNYFFPTAKISRDQGKILWWGERLVMPIYHPAAALRSPVVLIQEIRKSFVKLKMLVPKVEELKMGREKNHQNQTKEDRRQEAII